MGDGNIAVPIKVGEDVKNLIKEGEILTKRDVTVTVSGMYVYVTKSDSDDLIKGLMSKGYWIGTKYYINRQFHDSYRQFIHKHPKEAGDANRKQGARSTTARENAKDRVAAAQGAAALLPNGARPED